MLYNYDTFFEKITLNSSSLIKCLSYYLKYFRALMHYIWIYLFISWLIYLFVSHIVTEIWINCFLTSLYQRIVRLTNCWSFQCIFKSFHSDRTRSNLEIIRHRLAINSKKEHKRDDSGRQVAEQNHVYAIATVEVLNRGLLF